MVRLYFNYSTVMVIRKTDTKTTSGFDWNEEVIDVVNLNNNTFAFLYGQIWNWLMWFSK